MKCTQDGVILWDMVNELILLELLFHLEMKYNIAWDALSDAMEKQGVNMPTAFEPIEICAMNGTNKKMPAKTSMMHGMISFGTWVGTSC